MLVAVLLLASCSDAAPSAVDSDNPQGSSGPLPEKHYEDGTYTLMIYLCGSDLETRGGAATKILPKC